jgi:hypothetical protein
MRIVNSTDHAIDVPVSATGVDGAADGMTAGWTRVLPGEAILSESTDRAGA